jgi:predicted RNase H-like HicB family nuclease
MELEIILEQEEDGTYSVHCPALKGCHSQGATKEEGVKNIQEAIQLYLEVANEKMLTSFAFTRSTSGYGRYTTRYY